MEPSDKSLGCLAAQIMQCPREVCRLDTRQIHGVPGGDARWGIKDETRGSINTNVIRGKL